MDGVAPRLVCTVIGLCVGETKEADPMDDCSICKDVLTVVKVIVGENVTKVGRQCVCIYSVCVLRVLLVQWKCL